MRRKEEGVNSNLIGFCKIEWIGVVQVLSVLEELKTSQMLN